MTKPNFKIFGSILMLLGTCLGAGMLAIPLTAAPYTFATNFVFLLASWIIMTIGAFAILEVNLWMPSGSNLFTMAKNTLGNIGNTFSIIIYLLLLYALISAYISGCSDILHGIFTNHHWLIHSWQTTLIVFLLLFSVIACGIRIIDLTNRLLMITKLTAFFSMLFLMLSVINIDLTNVGQTISNGYSVDSFMVMNTAFGFAIILPSLRAYLDDNHANLTKTLIIGCCIPLVLYSLWVLAVQGLIPKLGSDGLIAIADSSNPNTNLITSIAINSGYSLLALFSKTFISISAITSFLGVGLCLVDFMKDMVNNIWDKYYEKAELGLANTCAKIAVIYTLSFAVPLIIVLCNPGIFIKALSYAGILVLTFLVVLPLAMLYSGRYRLHYIGKRFIPGGKIFILALIALNLLILLFTISNMFS